MRDLKYDILKHPNIALTTDGGAPAYKHGEDTRSYASIQIDPDLLEQAVDLNLADYDFELLCEEELEEKFLKQTEE